MTNAAPGTPSAHPRFAGKTAIITGAGGNIGNVIARRLAAEGANIVAVGRRPDPLAALANDLDPDRTLTIRADVTQIEDLQAMTAGTVDRFGGIDLLVANAGNSQLVSLEDTTRALYDQMIRTNLDSAFFGAQAVLPYLKKTRGSIVNISSVTGLGGHKGSAAFNAAKAAMINLTQSLAFEVGADGVRVNSVAPGLTFPEALDAVEPIATWITRASKIQALPGHPTPEDIAGVVAFLASTDARFVTGATIAVDGGASVANGLPDLSR